MLGADTLHMECKQAVEGNDWCCSDINSPERSHAHAKAGFYYKMAYGQHISIGSAPPDVRRCQVPTQLLLPYATGGPNSRDLRDGKHSVDVHNDSEERAAVG
ncbi:hypothetical protein WMY93_012728 [Mugilogobius chulae]|uniref:Uncharacterized protein n=1 Tax=Mugilogobius chulae TaxID=88201 RepID=A0AAW0P838_9GOBI